MIKHKCRIDAKIIFNLSAEQKREYWYKDSTECEQFHEMLTWIQKALPQFKDFEGEALNYVENWILCKSAEWLPDLTILLKQVCEWYDFVFLENLTSRA